VLFHLFVPLAFILHIIEMLFFNSFQGSGYPFSFSSCSKHEQEMCQREQGQKEAT